jgi:hypothetical protein
MGGVEETGSEWLHDLHCSPNTIWVSKSRRMKRAGHVLCMGREELHTGVWWGNLREEGQLEDLHIDERIILKCIFNN